MAALPTQTVIRFLTIDTEQPFRLKLDWCKEQPYFKQFIDRTDTIYVPIWSSAFRFLVQYLRGDIEDVDLIPPLERNMIAKLGIKLKTKASPEEKRSKAQAIVKHRKKLEIGRFTRHKDEKKRKRKVLMKEITDLGESLLSDIWTLTVEEVATASDEALDKITEVLEGFFRV